MSPADNVRWHEANGSSSTPASPSAGPSSAKRAKVTVDQASETPKWIERIHQVLDHEKNKGFLDASAFRFLLKRRAVELLRVSRQLALSGVAESAAVSDRPSRRLIGDLNSGTAHAENIVVSTVKDGQPYARYHVFRGFVPSPGSKQDSELLLTTTDAIMPKVDQIQSSSNSTGGAPSEIIFWTSPTGDQIRLRGLIYLYLPPSTQNSSDSRQPIQERFPEFDFEALRQEQWKSLSGHLRASFLRPKPGSEWPKDKKFDFQERLGVGEEGEEEALKRFSLVVFEPTFVDHSEQNAQPPVRYVWTKQADGSWEDTQVAP
ncbi:BZ3500_MvSof-1268-A1-R1_Chr8-2g10242 [Microbotryum saponariae]|uniref:BZ3500_MvSof-1268-A1-R1_Chr8-2g10242 protein n=1 Tax=Microbotryum saponariae TaxID=289078 RepID=A0A2X0LAF9_9BASI|nr:BZ3500_MvSof-1268-A1-R1_Chr8-2g10242 [Microbotryum saponariae]SDA02040.1 BZ3501_MvSof-1269-A2-R1_Chr8-2g09992 [Microbotryum saponariae]